jgi:hypothetical protein
MNVQNLPGCTGWYRPKIYFMKAREGIHPPSLRYGETSPPSLRYGETGPPSLRHGVTSDLATSRDGGRSGRMWRRAIFTGLKSSLKKRKGQLNCPTHEASARF